MNSIKKDNFWEPRYKSEGAMWKYEPADSAFIVSELFSQYGYRNILIPGFGYGRNAKPFIEKGFEVNGIEISGSAIRLARESGINCIIYHGSVISMPFKNSKFDGIFCYALIHLLNKHERRQFLSGCFSRLKPGGTMIFVTASKKMSMYGSGRYISKDRYHISPGLDVFFYDPDSVRKEFSEFGLLEFKDISEPVKFEEGHVPLKLIFVICRKEK